MQKSETYVNYLFLNAGVTNTFGRLMFGWLADLKCVNRLLLLKCVLILSGVSTAVSLLLTAFETKILYTCVYGLLIGECNALITFLQWLS